MAIQLKFYSDSGLTTEITPSWSFTNTVGSSTPIDQSFYIGSNGSSLKYEANSDPGIDQIVLTITDSATGTGHDELDFKLALTSGGLTSAVAGDPLNLGTQILSGVANAVQVWVRWTDAVNTVGTSTEISLTTNAIKESSQ